MYKIQIMWRQQSEQLEFHLVCPLIINGVSGLLICHCGEMEGCIFIVISSKKTNCVMPVHWAQGKDKSVSASCKRSEGRQRFTDFSISWKDSVNLESKLKLRKAHYLL